MKKLLEVEAQLKVQSRSMRKLNRVYVAGASKERHTRAKPVIAALKAIGYEITYDWTTDVDAAEAVGGELTLSEEVRREHAIQDYSGVLGADLFVLLAPDQNGTSKGSWVELGVALHTDCPIFIAGPCDRCLFVFMPDCYRFPTDEALVEHLRGTLDWQGQG